ncbi:hypothetical protein ACIQNG_20705 [Streptomyces sp. NPDC091377]|uniref:hypothetical protein n=1 Tax=Streptomyces sp. NPDC091377 TaxID=3365995 RepID=UPI00380A0099
MRGVLSAALIALACLLVPLGALASWVTYGLADTQRYVRTMAPLATDPAVRDAVADILGEGLAERASAAMTESPGAGAMAPFLRDAVHSFTRTEAFRVGWDEANRATHRAVLDAMETGDPQTGDPAHSGPLEDSNASNASRPSGASRNPQGPLERHGPGSVRVEDAPVTVDLAPVAAAVQRQLAEDNVTVGSRIRVGPTEVAVLPAEDLAPLRKGFHVLHVAAVWLPLTALGLAATGIALAARRRRAVTAMAVGTALGGALLGLAVALGRHLTLADLPAGMPEPAVGAVYDALTSTLRTVSWLLLALGLTVALACRYGPARRHRATATSIGTGTLTLATIDPPPPAPEAPAPTSANA